MMLIISQHFQYQSKYYYDVFRFHTRLFIKLTNTITRDKLLVVIDLQTNTNCIYIYITYVWEATWHIDNETKIAWQRFFYIKTKYLGTVNFRLHRNKKTILE